MVRTNKSNTVYNRCCNAIKKKIYECSGCIIEPSEYFWCLENLENVPCTRSSSYFANSCFKCRVKQECCYICKA